MSIETNPESYARPARYCADQPSAVPTDATLERWIQWVRDAIGNAEDDFAGDELLEWLECWQEDRRYAVRIGLALPDTQAILNRAMASENFRTTSEGVYRHDEPDYKDDPDE